MTISQFCREQFCEGSVPDPRTVRRWLESGELAGRRIGRQWYVDTDARPDPRVSEAVAMILGANA